MVRSAIDPIRPGASLILAWQIKHKHVVIIGGGFVAAGRKFPLYFSSFTPLDTLQPDDLTLSCLRYT